MFDRILLPLDGSDLAEAVFPYGEELARRLGSEVILLHVCEPTHKLAHNMHRLYIEKMAELMQQRLKQDCPQGKEARARAEHLFGDFSQSICQYVEKNGIGLVIMVAHGFTSLKVRVMGSIIDKVFRLVRCPTLLIQTGNTRQVEERKGLIRRILLPLDGSDNSEVALPIVAELAVKLKAKVTLFRMAPRAYYAESKHDIVGEVGIYDAELDMAEQERAHLYLHNIEEELRQRGIEVTHSVVLGTDPAQEISKAGKKANANLVVMATRGRSPITRWAPGSIAHKLLNVGDSPLLIVRQVAG